MNESPVCHGIRLLSPTSMGACCPLPPADTRVNLLKTLAHAPQFAGVDVGKLTEPQDQQLRLIIIAENDCVPRQLAAYLTRIRTSPISRTLTDMSSQELCGMASAVSEKSTAETLFVADAERLFQENDEGKALRHHFLESANQYKSLLFAHPTASLFSSKAINLYRSLCSFSGPDLLLAVKPNQMDRDSIEELRFSNGFRVCSVGTTSNEYLSAMLRQSLDGLGAFWDDSTKLSEIVEAIRRYRGSRFEDNDVEQAALNAVITHFGQPLTLSDFLPSPLPGQKSGWKELERMVDLQSVKEAVRRRIAADLLQSHKGKEPLARNLAFSGPPGTGKTQTARLIAKILREEGCGSGRFVEAGREHLVGQYLGHTSQKVSKCFDDARGGVLFIDEAGALFDSDGRDSFAQEAVNALVRHMENDRATMVIFATYPEEMEQFLHSNPGLSSRIAKIIHFTGYSNEALLEILRHLADGRGYQLPVDAEDTCKAFFQKLRERKGEDFGNGREARRLLETALEEVGLRFQAHPEQEDVLLAEDLLKAAEELLSQVPPREKSRPIGFGREC